jgi:hypothetical protein
VNVARGVTDLSDKSKVSSARRVDNDAISKNAYETWEQVDSHGFLVGEWRMLRAIQAAVISLAVVESWRFASAPNADARTRWYNRKVGAGGI